MSFFERRHTRKFCVNFIPQEQGWRAGQGGKCKCGYSKQDHLRKSNCCLRFHCKEGFCALLISGKNSVFYYDKLELMMYGPDFSIRLSKQFSAPQAIFQ